MKKYFFAALFSLVAMATLVACSEDDETNTSTPSPQSGGGISVKDDIDNKLIYSHGSLKLMMPEQLLAAVTAVTGHDFGSYDFTVPATTNISDFAAYCSSMGGCPDHVSRQRNNSIGTVYVMSLDKITSAACREDPTAIGMIPPGADETDTSPTATEIDAAINWQYQRFFGVPPRQDELDASRTYFTTHIAQVDPVTVFGTALRGHCMALLSSSKFIFY